MKKIIAWVLAVLVSSLIIMPLVPAPVGAVAPASAGPFESVCQAGQGADKSTVCIDRGNKSNPLVGPNGVLTKVIRLIDFVIAIVAVIVIIISGIRFIVSQGDANSVTGARNGILYAVIGLLVAMAAQLIVVFVLSKL